MEYFLHCFRKNTLVHSVEKGSLKTFFLTSSLNYTWFRHGRSMQFFFIINEFDQIFETEESISRTM